VRHARKGAAERASFNKFRVGDMRHAKQNLFHARTVRNGDSGGALALHTMTMVFFSVAEIVTALLAFSEKKSLDRRAWM